MRQCKTWDVIGQVNNFYQLPRHDLEIPYGFQYPLSNPGLSEISL